MEKGEHISISLAVPIVPDVIVGEQASERSLEELKDFEGELLP